MGILGCQQVSREGQNAFVGPTAASARATREVAPAVTARQRGSLESSIKI